ncbi:MAG: glycosyltransferase family 4 protein [Vicinamibacterales bacterium]|jgi:glycosyltransferase involved in cell wall biosynthesis|nr:glycosyltransferase family 4 protein [Vicinamibacterales bacterium]
MATPLNIVHICDHLGWPGSRMHGVKRLFAWMIPRFDPARYRVTLVSLRKKDLSADTLEELGIEVDYLGRSKFDPATWPDLLKLLDRKRTDLVHLHGYGATTFGRLAAAQRRWPVVLHEHANHTTTPWFQQVADHALARFTDIAIAVSKSTAGFVIDARKIPAERVKVVYLGAPLEEFARPREASDVTAARAALGVAGEGPVVGTVTRLMPSKGNQYFVEAVGHLAARLPQARFVIVGEGELQGELEAQAARLGVADRLVFAGFQRDVAAAYSAFDVAVFPSLWEGTPLTAFEALAMGKPIVSTDADGLSDILTPGTDALVVPRRDGAALAEAIATLTGDASMRERLGAAARATGQRYGIDRFVRRMEQLYDLLHATSRKTGRRGILDADLRFLTEA